MVKCLEGDFNLAQRDPACLSEAFGLKCLSHKLHTSNSSQVQTAPCNQSWLPQQGGWKAQWGVSCLDLSPCPKPAKILKPSSANLTAQAVGETKAANSLDVGVLVLHSKPAPTGPAKQSSQLQCGNELTP